MATENARRDAKLAQIRLLREQSDRLAQDIQAMFHLRGEGSVAVDKAQAEIAAIHLNIGFLTLARALFSQESA